MALHLSQSALSGFQFAANVMQTCAAHVSGPETPTPEPIAEATTMIRLLPLIAVLGLTACATASPTHMKNGQQGLNIDCSGEAMSWAKCYEKAEDSCAGTGYEIVGTDGTPQLDADEKTLGMDVGNFKHRSVLVVCK